MMCRVMALFLQMYCNPSKRELTGVNSPESMSLVVSFLKFLCSEALNDERVANGVTKWIVTVSMFCSHIGHSVFLFLALCRREFAKPSAEGAWTPVFGLRQFAEKTRPT